METGLQSAGAVEGDGPRANTGLVLGVDTCGPSGSVALGRLEGQEIAIVEQIELERRSYSATLVAAVSELLRNAGAHVKDLRAIAAVNGPGSFTGVRVGLSAVKGLAEPAKIPVVAVSRLEVLAHKSGFASAALDAHRDEVFLRLAAKGRVVRELLAGAAELGELVPESGGIAVCDDSAIALLNKSWGSVKLVRTQAPTAADALALCARRMAGGEFVDLELLDGHYLRRSDAEIFGGAAGVKAKRP
jgi:tRNA threonylcarbamoyladenosine biosynthesis protein TsaB